MFGLRGSAAWTGGKQAAEEEEGEKYFHEG